MIIYRKCSVIKMLFFLVICFISIFGTKCEENLRLVSRSRTSYLEDYTTYMDAVLLRFNVPPDTPFVSFKLIGEEMDLSIFGCRAKDITVYFKHGSPPVINPDGSKFPKRFMFSRSPMRELQFTSNKEPHYINITAPRTGSYYAALFKSYVDPKHQGITQQGLTPECFTFVEVYLYYRKMHPILIVTEERDYVVYANKSKIFKFFIPQSYDNAVLTVTYVDVKKLIVLIQADNVPDINNTLHKFETSKVDDSFQFWTHDETWHYIQFTADKPTPIYCRFTLKFFSARVNPNLINEEKYSNETNLYQNSVTKIHRKDSLTQVNVYRQYDLLRDVNTESFLFSYDLEAEINIKAPLAINVTSSEFSVLKFKLREGTDIGGTLQIILAFKPRILITESGRSYKTEPKDHVLVACIREGTHELPVWPNKCVNNKQINPATLILNETSLNSSVYIPYPDSGSWFISFKLFCGKCESCDCPTKCEELYQRCFRKCETDCSKAECDSCFEKCQDDILKVENCDGCDCDGPCQKTNKTCNSSIVFDVGSYPCVGGSCAANGKCIFMISQGISYSTCVCMNNYRGWDCGDNSNANSYAMIVLELVLLVLSNVMFIPSAYFAYRRKYYVESIVYSSTCIFSTFYHACDAGENIISYCIVRLQVLQFADFFSALLSIWVTLIAMAYLPSFWPSICHISGAIVIAFGTTVNKKSLWVFMIPVISGVIIVAASWYRKYRVTRQLFPSKKYLCKYLPIGLILVSVGLIMYSFLQTQANYKYLHSVWHILMAISVIFLLPNDKTFLPPSYI